MRKIRDLFYSMMVHTAWLYSDSFYIRNQFKHNLHYTPNLKHPHTFQEKLQWLKLYDRKPLYSTMVDKYDAKKFIGKKIGFEYVVPTLGIYEHASNIDYDSLPVSFVMKTTHDSGTVVICRDKSSLDITRTNSFLEKRLHRKYWLIEREWPYKNVKPRIIIEKFLGNNNEDLHDYKWFCFDGEPKLMFIISGRNTVSGHKADFYDMSGHSVKIWQPGYNNSEFPPSVPPCFKEMKYLAKVLSSGIKHLRVDFYYTDNHIYVGELTFSDSGGYLEFMPKEWNITLGNWITLPSDE